MATLDELKLNAMQLKLNLPLERHRLITQAWSEGAGWAAIAEACDISEHAARKIWREGVRNIWTEKYGKTIPPRGK